MEYFILHYVSDLINSQMAELLWSASISGTP